MKCITCVTAPLVVCALALAGCSAPQALTDLSRIEYRTASQGQRLEIPPDLVSPKADDRFAVPQRAAAPRLSASQRDGRAQGPTTGASARLRSTVTR